MFKYRGRPAHRREVADQAQGRVRVEQVEVEGSRVTTWLLTELLLFRLLLLLVGSLVG